MISLTAMQFYRTSLLHAAAPVALALGSSAAAQSPQAVSESYALALRATPAASGKAASAQYVAQASATALAADSDVAASASYKAEAGLSWQSAQLSAGAPVVLAIAPGSGDSDGGTAAVVLGFNLVDPAGVPTVLFAGQPAPSVVETSNTILDVVVPPGENAYGNPLGSINVRVQSSLGSDNADDAYVYLPALTQVTPPHVGQTYVVGYDAGQPAYHMLAFGGSIPGVAVPIPPLEGALEILSPMVVLTGLLYAPQGTASYVLPVPNDPSLVGFLIELQDSAITSLAPLGGSFTNRLTLTVEP